MNKMAMIVKLGVVPKHIKPLRRIAFLQNVISKQTTLRGGVTRTQVAQMSDVQKLFEARQLSRKALEDRERNFVFKNRFRLQQSQSEFDINKIKRLEGSRKMPKTQKWENNSEIPKQEQWITPKESTRHIYTDGSVIRNGDSVSGGAAFAINNEPPFSFPVASGNINHVEIEAALAAIKASPNNFKGNLYTDSARILPNRELRWNAWQKQIGLRKVLAHSGNPQNEAVDLAAKRVARQHLVIPKQKPPH